MEKQFFKIRTYLFLWCLLSFGGSSIGQVVSLNGPWETGINRNYTETLTLPGIPTTDTHNPAPGNVWFKRKVQLPSGKWSHATLLVKSALYRPKVYIDGQKVGEAIGGMMPIYFDLKSQQVRPGNEVTLEIELASLSNVPDDDPAKPSPADLWRSSQASWVRDDLSLILYNHWRVDRLIPFTDLEQNNVRLEWGLAARVEDLPRSIEVDLLSAEGKVLASKVESPENLKGTLVLPLPEEMKLWSPLDPNVYKIRMRVMHGEGIAHEKTINYAPKTFEVSADKSRFLLNGNTCTLRGGSIVWNRFAREAAAKNLIDDREWFYRAVIKPFKDHGANLLRFHLYPPPEWMLDMCDEYGLLTQLEAQYFHGRGGSDETLPPYYAKLMTMAAQHPSTAIIQLYNETEEELERQMYHSYLEISDDFPSYVIANHDTYNLHRYWWSMSENVALYANSWKDYDRPTIIDEFGANYMNEYWEVSSYPRAAPGFDRFLNKGHTPAMRQKMQEWSYGKIGEYWRRIGIQGVAPFCTLGPYEDGGNWYVGPLEEANLKPLWDALAPVFSPRAVSIELWDRNFSPGQEVNLPLYVFNEYHESDSLAIEIRLKDLENQVISRRQFKVWAEAYSTVETLSSVTMPSAHGSYVLEAEMMNPVGGVTVPVVSRWDVNVHQLVVPAELKNAKIGVSPVDHELKQALDQVGLDTYPIASRSVDVVVTSFHSWNAISAGDEALMQELDKAITKGKKVVMLDVGPKFHGEKCPEPAAIEGLDGRTYPAHTIAKADTSKNTLLIASRQFSDEFEAQRKQDIWTGDFPGGIGLSMKYAFEPESHFHPSANGEALWQHLGSLQQTWLWNGLRGGLTVPAVNLFINDLDQASFLDFWAKRGADTTLIKSGPYYAYELEGYFGFSSTNDDLYVLQDLYKRVHFVVEDLVSLKGLLNPDSDAKIQDISAVYQSLQGKSEKIVPMVIAGYGLNKTPVIMVEFDHGAQLMVSNLFTAGRLTSSQDSPELYGYRYDPVALQFVLNMAAYGLNNGEADVK
ncbi:glycoside hydrolase family 2 protein [Marinoscillum furvescens]|uniref:Glycosyl hydrolase family 2 n=1 Tax=Marinoscillum furvescens DSM 4134 TaxID=1122208 RepID=A0A3D9L3Q3_MARFU|nr:hypothetical protein [Marinoscillum furvescens]REE00091.1 hypothetical protein C7460_10628 [Marinoscillum furvescens DSM 4134]